MWKKCRYRNCTKKEEFNVLNDRIEVETQVLTCKECGEEIFCEELDEQTIENVYNIYRKKHKLLFPEEFKKIRKNYGLSQRAIAALLNMGDKTIHRYENGAIQNKTYNSLLLFLKSPENMLVYLKETENSLNENQLKSLMKRVEELIEIKE